MELQDYEKLSKDELLKIIGAIRDRAGDKLTLAAHYYAPDDVVAIADETGDSLALAKKAAESSAEAVLFCGVHFMLETADLLMNRPEKLRDRGGKRAIVFAPDPSAGCPMADMITFEQATEWENELATIVDPKEFVPITYVNSSAETKAFCGRRDGAVCTSANAEKVVREALSRRPKILFMPDSRLGRVASLAVGVDPDQIAVWTPGARLGGLEPDAIRRAKAILWDGYCPVHQKFSPELVRKMRDERPDAQFWAHPESRPDVAALADGCGSTTKLIDVAERAPAGSTVMIGTEWTLVDRLRRAHPDKTILYPADEPSVCLEMAKSTLPKVAYALARWERGEPINVASTPQEIADDALNALKSLL